MTNAIHLIRRSGSHVDHPGRSDLTPRRRAPRAKLASMGDVCRTQNTKTCLPPELFKLLPFDSSRDLSDTYSACPTSLKKPRPLAKKRGQSRSTMPSAPQAARSTVPSTQSSTLRKESPKTPNMNNLPRRQSKPPNPLIQNRDKPRRQP